MPRYTASFIALGALATLSSGRLAAAPESPRPPAASAAARASDPQLAPPTISRPSVPLRFEPLPAADNGTRVFVARSAGYAVHVGPTWAEVHATARPGATAAAGADAIAMRFVGAAAGPREVSLEGAATTVNYLVGADRERWTLGLEARARVRFRDVYPGIDVAYYGTDREVEYDVLLDPGADPAQVRLQFSGAGRVAITADGDLELGAAAAPVRVRAPFAYQLEGQARVTVPSRYVLHADGTVGFALGRFDRRKALVIDPILSYSRLLGASGLDEAASVAVDAAGNVYVAGTTSSPGFPGASGSPGGIDLFVTKLDARGSTVLYSTYIGGSGIDEARGMTIDTLGNVYVVGSTTSTNFPTVSPRQATLAGASDGFLLRVSTTGGGLGFSTYFGGSDVDEVNAVAVDGARNMYIAGSTRSANFPLLSEIQAYGGALDGFVARFLANGTLTFSTYHGGNAVDTLDGIAVDPAGNINTVGSTSSTNLPVLNAARATYSGRVDAFLSRFGPTGTLLFCSYFGGSRNDAGRAVAVLPDGWAFIAGSTNSPDFPVQWPIQPAIGGELDAFLLAVSPTGALAWSTYYGGTRSERGRALALNAAGMLILAGQTFSPDMPLVRPAQPRTGGNRDTFVVELAPPYTAFNYATYLGGSNNDEGSGVAVDRVGRVFTAGAASYPSPGALGASDAFIYGISSGLAGVDTDMDGLDDDWETQFGTDPETNDAAADPDGDGVTNAQERANNTHPTGYFTRFLAEGSTGAFFDERIALFNPGARHRHGGAALPAPGRRGDPAGPRDSVTQPRHGQSRNDRRPRERGVRDRHREQPVGGRRPHDDVGRERLRQPFRDLDRAAGDDLVPGRRLHGGHVRPLLPAPEPECQRRRRDHHVPPAERRSGHEVLHRRPAQPSHHQHRQRDRLRRTAGHRAHAAEHRRLGDHHLDERRADPGRARDVHDGQRPRLRCRPRQRRRHGSADQLVPCRRLDRLVLRPVHPAVQPRHDTDDRGDHVSPVGRRADRAPVQACRR